MQKWEYKAITVKAAVKGLSTRFVDIDSLTSELNSFGLEGWEIISMVAINGINGITDTVDVLLKRKVE
jgi:hypothetical protein